MFPPFLFNFTPQSESTHIFSGSKRSLISPNIRKMPAIATHNSSQVVAVTSGDICETVRSNEDSTCQKRKLRSSGSMTMQESSVASMSKLKSPRRCVNSSQGLHQICGFVQGFEKDSGEKLLRCCKSPVKRRLADSFSTKPKWNPLDVNQMGAVKEALHVSTAQSTVVCREDEQKMALEYCKQCIEQEKGGSLYVCGCPGTGKSLSMDKVRQLLLDWAHESGFQVPDVLAVNCTSLTKTSEIFSKILGSTQQQKKANSSTSPLTFLQKLYTKKQPSSAKKIMIVIADELDYLITRDKTVLHDLFMLTTLPFSKCVLIGIANAIDLADRFLPRLQSLNCKPMVVNFRAYSKDQILRILQERLMAFSYTVFQPQALELCARKVAAASGDMRKALSVCRSAIEILEAELKESTDDLITTSPEEGFSDLQTAPALKTQESNIVRIDHMAVALSKTFKSPAVDTIFCLPQHQQIVLCSVVKSFCGAKKDTTIGELNKLYMDICKSVLIPPVGILEFSCMCRVLNDQGLLKLGLAREDKLKRVTLKVDEADITFALQGVRFFRNCLQ